MANTKSKILKIKEPQNDPDLAFSRLKKDIKHLGSGDSLSFFSAIPDDVANWLKTYCALKGISLIIHGDNFRYSIMTVADKIAERKLLEERMRALEDYFNSPG